MSQTAQATPPSAPAESSNRVTLGLSNRLLARPEVGALVAAVVIFIFVFVVFLVLIVVRRGRGFLAFFIARFVTVFVIAFLVIRQVGGLDRRGGGTVETIVGSGFKRLGSARGFFCHFDVVSGIHGSLRGGWGTCPFCHGEIIAI